MLNEFVSNLVPNSKERAWLMIVAGIAIASTALLFRGHRAIIGQAVFILLGLAPMCLGLAGLCLRCHPILMPTLLVLSIASALAAVLIPLLSFF